MEHSQAELPLIAVKVGRTGDERAVRLLSQHVKVLGRGKPGPSELQQHSACGYRKRT
jgi:hypothetical protein